MLIPSTTIFEEGNEIPNGSIIKKCRICNNTYIIDEELKDKTNNVCDRVDCKKVLDAEFAEAIHLLMKPNGIENASEVIKKALGK